MKLVIISDTHGYHDDLDLPDGDVLIHCGDVCGLSDEDSVIRFAKWFDSQPHKNKICIAGNHDKYMDGKYFENSEYLLDSGLTIDGVKFWGSPWTPTFYDWYFMKDRGAEIAKKWYLIPDDTDVLITHGPPSGSHLAKTAQGQDVGCAELAWSVYDVMPKVHCFGHIHEGYGMTEYCGTTFINASICNLSLMPVNNPVVIDI